MPRPDAATLSLVAARADALVTGDRGLLKVGAEFTVPVWPPAELRRRLGE